MIWFWQKEKNDLIVAMTRGGQWMREYKSNGLRYWSTPLVWLVLWVLRGWSLKSSMSVL